MGMWENFKRIMNGEESYEDTAPEENEIPFNDNTAARREARPTPPADQSECRADEARQQSGQHQRYRAAAGGAGEA